MSYNKEVKKRILLTLVFLFGFIFVLPEPAQADLSNCSEVLTGFSIDGFETPYGSPFEENFELVPPPLTVRFNGLGSGSTYEVACLERDCLVFCWDDPIEDSIKTITANSAGAATWTVDNNSCWSGKSGTHKIRLTDTFSEQACYAQSYNVVKEDFGLSCAEKSLKLSSTGQEGCYQPGDDVNWRFKVVQIDGTPYQGELMIRASNVYGGLVGAQRLYDTNSAGVATGTDTVITGENATEYVGHPIVYTVYADGDIGKEIESCKIVTNNIRLKCTEDDRESGASDDQPFEICNQIPEGGPRDKCLTCFNQSGVWTAIGCIDTSSTEGIVGKLMTVGIGIAGGIALLMILAAAFLFATSEGEPKRTSEAKEILTSAIIGLVFIIFSVTILQFIGVNILKIPGFGE